MENDLEKMLTRLRDEPTPSSPDLETRVWAAIAQRARGGAPGALWGWRSAAAALLVALGILTQAVSSAHTPEVALFTPRSAIAPSTLLGEDR